MSLTGSRSDDRSANLTFVTAELLRRARAGETQALSRLFSRYLPQLVRWAHGRVPNWARNAADTEDLVQDALLRTFRRLGSFEPQREGALLGYLRRALINGVRTQFRYASRHPSPKELNDALVHAGASPLDFAIDREDQRRYRAALTRLRTADRDAIVGRVELGYTYDQLAMVLNKPTPEAARLAVRRALLRLGDELRGA
jgi:RNA polymerase sigma-70 factor (ECF subfamily)